MCECPHVCMHVYMFYYLFIYSLPVPFVSYSVSFLNTIRSEQCSIECCYDSIVLSLNG